MFQIRERDDRCRQAGGLGVERPRERDQSRRRDRRARRSPGLDAVFGADAELQGHGALDPAQPRRRGRHPAGVDSRPLHGDGARRRRRLHRAGDQRARDGLRHGARGHPRGEEARTPARSSSRSRAPRSATPSSGRTSTRRSSSARRCARASRGPLFIQGDHVQTNAKKYNSPDRDKELDALRALIKEEIAAGFYNIDIDTSTLVDLDKADAAPSSRR